MSFFWPRYKNDDKNYLTLKDCYLKNRKLLLSDSYLSHREYSPLLAEAKDAYDRLSTLKENDTLRYWCKKTKTDYKEFRLYLDTFATAPKLVQQHNKEFLSSHLVTDKEYLDTILSKENPNLRLDSDQKKVVLCDEDYRLVIAGAGAGKTTALEAKAKYLVERKHIPPERILVISFTKKATEELKRRFDTNGIPAKISTFHAIGNALISANKGKHSVKSQEFRFFVIRNYLRTKLDDEGFINKRMLFFASYLDMPFDSAKSVELYKRSLANNDFSTRKNDLDAFQESLTKKKITIKSEYVRSVQECQIANFLYINGIEYEYEPVYPYCIRGTNKPYTPDFLLKQGDKEVYLEHFGIAEDGTNWRFTKDELARYKKCIRDKILLHRIHKTKLIYTFSSYNDGKDLIVHLKDLLLSNGFSLCRKDSKTIYHELASRAEERYFIRIVQLICNFINRFKTNNYKLEKRSEFQSQALENKDERTNLFLDIARQCYLKYEAALKESNAIDFEDRINNAAEILDEKIANKEKLPYDYIFIDEYQDISFQRFNLAEKLAQCSDAKIVAVGDDWQSIYRFSGSDITLFTDFEKRRGYAKVLYLNNTHRNSQELIDVAANFVRKNTLQKRKVLKSPLHLEDPIVVVSYDDSFVPRKQLMDHSSLSPYQRRGKAIETALECIKDKFGEEGDVLLLGRYNFDGRRLGRLSGRFLCTEDGRIRSEKFPKRRIRFRTAHSSKGLGADNVIVVNGKDDLLGFPSKIEDDPVRKLVLSHQKEIDYAEERRLFYVALTRTKNKVYLITPIHKPSQFIQELRASHRNIVLNGPRLEKTDGRDFRYKCPRCGYPLQIRKKKTASGAARTLYVCSNDPEVCGFVTNDVSGGNRSIRKCPDCESGYLIVKKVKNAQGEDTGHRILGCTNYKADKTGCNYFIDEEGFADTWEKACQKRQNYLENGKKLDLSECILAGYPISDLANIVRYALTKAVNGLGFSFTKTSLSDFLTGNPTKALVSYRLNQNKAFGCVEKCGKKTVLQFIQCLIDSGWVAVDEKGRYPHLSFSGWPRNEKTLRRVFEFFVH